MVTLKFTLKPLGPFATALQGDTFFGQLCWAILRTQGEVALKDYLQAYATAPFAVVSDAFPSGFLPRPCLPSAFLGAQPTNPALRKIIKRQQWVPLQKAATPLQQWLQHAHTEQDILKAAASPSQSIIQTHRHMHNSINRLTGTTGTGGFSPYAVEQFWLAQSLEWDMYIVLNPELMQQNTLQSLVEHIGHTGYGKDANLGAGRFKVEAMAPVELPHHNQANSYLTLAACAPQGKAVNPKGCFYQTFTRYGRHGDWAALVNPFKAPLLMAKTAAVLQPVTFEPTPYFGQGLGGHGQISHTIPATVHQGYAPVLHIHLPEQGVAHV